jgi:hypothetical protein
MSDIHEEPCLTHGNDQFNTVNCILHVRFCREEQFTKTLTHFPVNQCSYDVSERSGRMYLINVALMSPASV